jgi:hypothetical protein
MWVMTSLTGPRNFSFDARDSRTSTIPMTRRKLRPYRPHTREPRRPTCNVSQCWPSGSRFAPLQEKHMSTGPLELLVLKFSGNDFKGDILPEIQRVVDAGIVRVIDILLAIRLGDEPLRVLELNELQEEVQQRFEPVVGDVTDMLTEQDAYALSAGLGPDSSVALLLFEHTWASRVADAIENAGGEVVMDERLPRAVVKQLYAKQLYADVELG